MIRVANVTKQYGRVTVLNDVCLEIPRGGVTALIGANGAGKSTLLSVVGRLLQPERGTVTIDGLDVCRSSSAELARRLSILRQDNQVAVRLSVRELIEFGRFPYCSGRLTDADREHVERAIDYLELRPFEDRPIDRLSGGQRQRVFIAMVLCQDTDYVLLDEPLNNLDMRHSAQAMNLIRRMATDLGKTVVVVLHDINFAAHHADRIVGMKDGRVVADGTPDEIVTAAWIREIFDIEVPVHRLDLRPFAAYFATH